MRFTVYASPYTPAFNGYAFSYKPSEGRFNEDTGARNPIPDDVDIVMTHGPPRFECKGYRLDLNHEDEHCGCNKLGQAIRRTKPRLHCFGHIIEGRGVAEFSWDEDEGNPRMRRVEIGNDRKVYIDGGRGEKTMLVNAAIRDGTNKGVIVEMEV